MAAIGFKNTGDGDPDSYMWFKTADNGNEYFKWQHSLSGGGTNEWMSLKSDNLRVKGHPVYHEGNKPTVEEIQAEPRFNKTIDLTGLSTNRYYPVWWQFPSNNGANSWLAIHRWYAEDREKEPFGKDGDTHIAGLLLQIEGGDVRWGGDAHYLNIKRVNQTYRKTVRNVRHDMMSIARPIDGKYPLYEKVKPGDIVECRRYSGCYLRGGLTYHVTSNFSGIHYSRKDDEFEIARNLEPQSNFEIKWMVKSYAIDDPLLGKEYDDNVLPYSHDYKDIIELAKNALPITGGTLSGQISSSSPDNYRIERGGYGVFLRLDGENFYILQTNKNDSKGSWNNFRPFSINMKTGKVLLDHETKVNGNLLIGSTGTTIAQDGNIWGSRWGNKWLWDAVVELVNNRTNATKNTAQKEPNGWWKCGDTGMIIQWGVVANTIGAGTINVPLTISFPTRGLWAIGYVNDAIEYDRDNCSSSAKLLNNEKIRVTVDSSQPSVWLAIGY
ncbi:hypothetical protein [Xenorhabdus sp. PB30.3]|uniref:phage tail fiber protein n=1 Tax=Xenorhabdus sp. PB30.3 TaxID=2788941 RepID=UPI0030DB11AD